MEHTIVVGKVHGGADAHGEHVRREAQIALVEDGTFCFAARRRVGRVQPDDGIRLRPIAGACSSAQVGGRRAGGRRPQDEQTDDEQGNPHACSESHIGTRVKELSSFKFQGPEP